MTKHYVITPPASLLNPIIIDAERAREMKKTHVVLSEEMFERVITRHIVLRSEEIKSELRNMRIGNDRSA